MSRTQSLRAEVGPRLEVLENRDVPSAVASPALVTPVRLFAAGPGPGSQPIVNVYNPDGSLKLTIEAYASGFLGGVTVALADVNDDGTPDIITGAGPGGGPNVKVFSGVDGGLLANFFAYNSAFTGGVFVAGGDVNADGHADIVTGAGPGGGPIVNVFNGVDDLPLASIVAYNPAFAGGVRVAAGDVNSDGRADIITGAGPGGGPHVKVFSGVDFTTPLASIFAYNAGFTGGVFVASGDVNADGHADIITGVGPGGGPHVRVFSGITPNTVLASFFAYDVNFTGGVRVAAANVTTDGFADVVTGPGPGMQPEVIVFDTANSTRPDDFVAFNPTFLGGVFVG